MVGHNKKINDANYVINIDEIIDIFDGLYNDLSYQFPTHIKAKVIKKYGNIKKLPNSLQLECETPKSSSDRNDFITVNLVSS